MLIVKSYNDERALRIIICLICDVLNRPLPSYPTNQVTSINHQSPIIRNSGILNFLQERVKTSRQVRNNAVADANEYRAKLQDIMSSEDFAKTERICNSTAEKLFNDSRSTSQKNSVNFGIAKLTVYPHQLIRRNGIDISSDHSVRTLTQVEQIVRKSDSSVRP